MVSPAQYSGFNGDPVMNQANADAWGAWRNDPLTDTTIYTDRLNGWDPIVGRSWTITNYRPHTNLILDIHQPMWPTKDPSGRVWGFRDVIDGKCDAHWDRWGTTVAEAEKEGWKIRTSLAWEANGDWYPWRATDAKLFLGAWERIYTRVKEKAPNHKIGLIYNGHPHSHYPPSHNPLDILPRHGYIDFLGTDNYDAYPAATSAPHFDQIAVEKGGLTWWWELAQDLMIPFQVGEWGVSSQESGKGGGDSVMFIEKMWDWFASHKTYSECYFNNSEPDNVRSDLKKINPKAGKRYRELWGPGQQVPPPAPPPATPHTVTDEEYALILEGRRIFGH